VTQVLLATGLEVVDADHVHPVGEQRVTQMRAEEARPSGDKSQPACPILHHFFPPVTLGG
jgi:hypothetical protein